MNNRLILSNVTSIDLAYLHEHRLKGYSVTPVFEVSGPLNGQEQVVIDFGTCKKRIKEIIDHKFEGWDHKLIWSPDEIVHTEVYRFTRTIETLQLVVSGPDNAFQRLEYKRGEFESTFLAHLSKVLSESLGLNVKASLPTSDRQFVYSMSSANKEGFSWDIQEFSYTHGLQFSSSWGCQNIAHGHRSLVVIGFNSPEADETIALSKSIVDLLDDAYIANRNARIASSVYEYLTPRGWFRLQMLNQKIVEMDTEPTIENILQYTVHRVYRGSLSSAVLGISEGRWKGSITTLHS